MGRRRNRRQLQRHYGADERDQSQRGRCRSLSGRRAGATSGPRWVRGATRTFRQGIERLAYRGFRCVHPAYGGYRPRAGRCLAATTMRIAHISDFHVLALDGAIPFRLLNKRATGLRESPASTETTSTSPSRCAPSLPTSRAPTSTTRHHRRRLQPGARNRSSTPCGAILDDALGYRP